MLKYYIELTETAQLGDNSLWVCHYERHLSHSTLDLLFRYKVCISAALVVGVFLVFIKYTVWI